MSAPAESTRRRRSYGWLLLVALALYAALIHHGLGPRPDADPAGWWTPTGFLRQWLVESAVSALVEDPWLGVAVLLVPVLALAAGAWWLTPSALLRTLALGLALGCGAFLYYGLQPSASRVWWFFHWRWSAVMLVAPFGAAAAIASPLLARSWLRLAWPARLLLYLPVFLAAVACLRNATGTDPQLRFAISPWPVVPVFGLEWAAALALGLLAVLALALAGLSAWPRHRLRAGAALALALGAPLAWLGLDRGLHLELTVTSCLLAVLAALLAERRGAAGRPRLASVTALGVLLAGLPLVAGQLWAGRDYRQTREVAAQAIIDALAGHYAEHGDYPDALEDLVGAGRLSRVPAPSIGFAVGARAGFTYQNFGTSYLLEFSAPGWVQCAYNPPWEDEEPEETSAVDPEDEPDEEDGALLGSWSCPSKPPALW